MNRITDVQILERFNSNLDGKVYGIYWAKFNGEGKLFVENNDTIAAVTHSLGEPATKCLAFIRDDVAEELKNAILKAEYQIEKKDYVCNRCGTVVEEETNEVLKNEYPYYCPECEENMYSFEVSIK